MKTKVCYTIYSLSWGGAEGQLIELLRHLDRDRFDPSLILWEDGNLQRVQGLVRDVRVLGVERHASGRRVSREYRAALAFRRLSRCLSEIRPQILHAILSGPCILAAAARVTRLVPCAIHSRRTLVDAYRHKDWIRTIVDSMATKISDLVIGNCSAIVREMLTLDGVPESRAQLISNGVDTARFSPQVERSLREELGWEQDNFVFGMVANFLPYKRHLDFVQVAALIHAVYPKSRFLLAGEDRGEMESARDAIEKAGLGPHTKILPGMKKPERVFAAMDVYICTSQTEGLSNSLLEAMSSGVPVIATDVGGNREAVADGVTGFLVPCHDPEATAKAACELVANPDLLLRLSRNARQRALELFSIEKMVRAHEHVYTRLLEEKRASNWARLTCRA
jgi:glycosyltransferase involved in cell wall biosynthesis